MAPIGQVEGAHNPESSRGAAEIAMILRSALLILIVAMPMTVAGEGNFAEEVLCKRRGSGKLRVRPSECKRKETQVDLTNLDASETNATRWSWLGEGGGTYWYVPPENLPAIQWNTADPESYTSISDQTVWHIQSYQGGYFFGPLVVKLETAPRLCQFLIGSVTPDGRVLLRSIR